MLYCYSSLKNNERNRQHFWKAWQTKPRLAILAWRRSDDSFKIYVSDRFVSYKNNWHFSQILISQKLSKLSGYTLGWNWPVQELLHIVSKFLRLLREHWIPSPSLSGDFSVNFGSSLKRRVIQWNRAVTTQTVNPFLVVLLHFVLDFPW